MQQLTQKLKNGAMQVLEVPCPALSPGMVLVRNHYSLISAGTEGSTVKTARAGFLAKAKERPQQVRQVVETLRSQGFTQTYRAVMKKLDAHSPLGYSCAGEVIEAATDVTSFKAGDLVACAGLTASHAEIVSVPANLCVRLAPEADLRQAAYNTLGVIAMQGVRQADLRLGESCAIIGMGLLGQLTALILRAGGVRVVGVDIDPAMVEIAGRHCLDLALTRGDDGIEGRIHQFTRGLGCDAVIIAAATGSSDPINFAGAICRKRGTVVVVGAVPTGFDRDPHYYRKELQLKMSCSYGPGRYDPLYEEKGIDYPVAYVRWTENRNMQAFQDLLDSGRIDLRYLTSHSFALKDAPAAYDMMMAKSEPYIGILIEYDVTRPLATRRISPGETASRDKAPSVGIGFIGAGSYAQSHLLPNLVRKTAVSLVGVATATGTGARSVSDRFGFAFCSGEAGEILSDPRVNTVFIATRHDSHAAYVLRALQAGRHVFVEKPLCLSEEELERIAALFVAGQAAGRGPLLMVGFNRRFSPLALAMKSALAGAPLSAVYRVNAGFIPADSWIQDPAVGGGRIVGEVCHFIDFLIFLTGSLPVSVHAAALEAPGNLHDSVTVTLRFANGSLGTVCYFAQGDKGCPKERVEIFANRTTLVLDDFKSLTTYAGGRKKEKRLSAQDKGQAGCVGGFIDAILKGEPAPVPFTEIHAATLATLKALESIRTGQVVTLAFPG
jgi:predicted dehydrogenase/threonine dehydrogenase-like Zn-dependent dehydrogenase